MTKLERVDWIDAYSIGNSKMDLEHQKLLYIYNELINLSNNNGSRKMFAEILSKLTDYTLEHFKHEEEYMKMLNYPKYKEHKKDHKEFILQVATFNTNLLSATPPKPEEILIFVKNWWINHILKIDIEYEEWRKILV